MLEQKQLDECFESPPQDVQALLADAANRADALRLQDDATPVTFHRSQHVLVYHSLRRLISELPAANRWLCEWGAGLAETACLWSLLGGRAAAIELDALLLRTARELAATHNAVVDFAAGNFALPVGPQLVEPLDQLDHFTFAGPDGHRQLGIPPDQFDVVFVYPWPGERRLIEDLFDHVAKPAAHLLQFHGGDELTLHQKSR
ncbi:MAG: hypothetical protein QGG36_30735 [Pirellulaceae bacterium]|nr:hypothetical protein [Pirellulaceae bacterium]MDP7020214.1 hypothetical protein [Pirellulaceae bacterium]